jgi:hypothetical protein
MTDLLEEELKKHRGACMKLMQSKKKRLTEVCELIESKNAAFVGITTSCSTIFDHLEQLILQGFKDTAQHYQRVFGCFMTEMNEKHSDILRECRSRYSKLISERQQYELHEAPSEIIDRAMFHHTQEKDLIRSLSTNCEQVEIDYRDKLHSLIETNGELPAKIVKVSHSLRHAIDLLSQAIEDGKRDLRNLKQETIKAHSRRNELRDELVKVKQTAASELRRNRFELQRSERNLQIYEARAAQIGRIHEDKFMRIYKSNIRELQYLTDLLDARLCNMNLNVQTSPRGRGMTLEAMAATLSDSQSIILHQIVQLIASEIGIFDVYPCHDPARFHAALSSIGVTSQQDVNQLLGVIGSRKPIGSRSCLLQAIEDFLGQRAPCEQGESINSELSRSLLSKPGPRLETRIKDYLDDLFFQLTAPFPESDADELGLIHDLLRELLNLRLKEKELTEKLNRQACL